MHFSLARYTYQRAFRAKFSLTPSSSIAKVCPSSGFVDRSYVGSSQEDSDMVKQHGQNDTQTNSICQIRKTIYFKILSPKQLLPRAEIRKRKVPSIRNDCPLSLRTVTRESINDKKDMNQGPVTLNASRDPST